MDSQISDQICIFTYLSLIFRNLSFIGILEERKQIGKLEKI